MVVGSVEKSSHQDGEKIFNKFVGVLTSYNVLLPLLIRGNLVGNGKIVKFISKNSARKQ